MPRTRSMSASVLETSGLFFSVQFRPSAFRPAPASAPSSSAIPSPLCSNDGGTEVPQPCATLRRGSEAGQCRSVVSSPVASYDLIRDLPLEIESYELQGLEFNVP